MTPMLTSHTFWILAFVPGLMALGYMMLFGSGRYESRKNAVLEYRRYREAYALRTRSNLPFLAVGGTSEDLDQQQPRLREYFLGALALTVPFVLVAALSAKPYNIGTVLHPRAEETQASKPSNPPSQPSPGNPGEVKTQEVKAQEVKAQEVKAQEAGTVEDGIQGLVFAGYGVYVYTLLLLVYRLNASALSPKFLLNSAFRGAITLVLGFAAGQTKIFSALSSPNQSLALYFALGVFPSWAYQALQQKVKEIFKPAQVGEGRLSLELVDGVDDLIAERLGELSISDVQHLATSDPGDLTIRTLYPIERAIDWIDQAILITYLREKIQFARQSGIRGAIDMSGVYKGATAPPSTEDPGENAAPEALDDRARSQKLMADLAILSGLSQQVLYNVGASLKDDYYVRFLADLWHHRMAGVPTPEAAKAEAAKAEAAKAEAAKADGQPGEASLPEAVRPENPGSPVSPVPSNTQAAA